MRRQRSDLAGDAPARAVLGPHSHRHAYLSFVSSGSYTERLDGLTRDCEASTLLCHAAVERHANVFHDQPVSLLRHMPPPR